MTIVRKGAHCDAPNNDLVTGLDAETEAESRVDRRAQARDDHDGNDKDLNPASRENRDREDDGGSDVEQPRSGIDELWSLVERARRETALC